MSREISGSELNKSAVKAGFFYVFIQLLVRGITFILTPFYSRLVSVAQYGEIRVYESWLLILVPVFSLSLYRSLARAKFDFAENYEAYTSSALTLSLLSVAGIFAVISLFARKAFMSFCGMDKLMFVFAILYTLGHTSVLFYQNREKQLMRYKSSTLLTVCMMVPATVLSILLLYWGNRTGRESRLVDLRVIGYFSPQIIGGIVAAGLIVKQGRARIRTDTWRYAVLYSIPLIPEMLSIQIMNQADKIMVQKLVSSESAGIFTLATTVSFIIWIVESAVWDAWLPWLYEKIARNEIRDIQKPWDYIACLFGYFSWALVMLAPEMILVLGGSRYQESVFLVAPMVTGTLFRFYSYSFSAVENYQKKTVFTAIGTVTAMLVNVVLNVVFIRAYGYRAAAYTTAFSYFVLLLLQGFIEKKVCGMRCVSMSRLVIIAVICFVLNVVSMAFFGTKWFVRWGVFAAFSILTAWKLLPETKTILKLFKKG